MAFDFKHDSTRLDPRSGESIPHSDGQNSDKEYPKTGQRAENGVYLPYVFPTYPPICGTQREAALYIILKHIFEIVKLFHTMILESSFIQ